MSVLEALLIRGVRAFGSDNPQTIHFERPLTLIVGYNGAGKTTIVECLKVVTCGEYPPSSDRGKSFVHDPKMSRVPEVKGQIRVTFRTPGDQRVCAIRSMQLSNTKDKKGILRSTFRVVESVLMTKGVDGNVSSISQKCADMDVQVPLLMGVSKAVLDNVIFCHQDDSNWPLADMGTLKKKFDSLFGAARYTKALKAIDDERKKQKKISLEKKTQTQILLTHLNLHQQLNHNITNCKDKHTQFTLFHTKLVQEKEEQTKRAQQAREKYNGVAHLESAIRAKKDFIQNMNNDLQNLKNRADELFEESAAELSAFKPSFQTAFNTCKDGVEAAEKEMPKLEASLSKVSSQIDCLQAQNAEGYRNDERLRNCRHNLEKIKDSLATACPISFVREQLVAFSQIMKETENEQLTVLGQLDKKSSQTTTQHSDLLSKLYADQQLSNSLEMEIEKIQKQQIQLSQKCSPHAMAKADEELADLHARLRATEASQEQHQLASKIEALGMDLVRLRGLGRKLEEQKKENEKRKEILTQIRIFKDREKTQSVNLDLTLKHLESLPHAFTSEAEAKAELTRLEKEVADVSKECESLKESRWRRSGECSKMREEVESGIEKLNIFEGEILQIYRSFEIDSNQKFDNVIQNFQLQLDILTKDTLGLQHAHHFYQKFLQNSAEKGRCTFCTRAFGTEEELEVMRERVNKKLDQLPGAIEEAQNSRAKYSQKIQKIADLRPQVCQTDQLKQSLPLLSQRLTNLQNELAETEGKIAENEKKKIEKREALTSLAKYIEIFEKHEGLREVLKHTQNEIKERQKAAGVPEDEEGLPEKINNLQDQISTLETERETIWSRLEKLKSEEAENKMRLGLLEKECASKREGINELKMKNEKIEELTATLQATKKRVAQHRDLEIKVSKQAQAAKEEYRTAQADFSRRLHDLSAKKSEFQNTEKQINELEQNIKEAETLRSRNTTLQSQMSELHEQKQHLTKELVENRTKLQNLREDLKKRTKLMNNLLANIDLKEKEESVERAEADLAKMGTDTSQDPVALKEEMTRCEVNAAKASEALGRMIGLMEENGTWLEKQQKDAQNPVYHNIQERHRGLNLEYTSHDLAMKDLTRYHTSLDKALMKYHSTRMEEINVCIKELWLEVYTSSDIDYIAIRSDADEETPESGSASRSYNYRLVMIQKGVELEMRGRCSAGQKVLASIIVRLALAESFCANCGILSLDEPTTNLDSRNSENLAKALSNLIHARKNSAGFQLILITHDDEFVARLASRGLCDHFYKVEKNDKGLSTISKADIRGY